MAADFLTCGLCQTEFPLAHIVAFMQHKKYDCDTAATPGGLLQDAEILQKYSCTSCPEKFAAAVTLLQHVQFRHQIKVFMEEVYNCKTEASLATSAKPVSASATPRTAAAADEGSPVAPMSTAAASTFTAAPDAAASASSSISAPASAAAAVRRADGDCAAAAAAAAVAPASDVVPLKKCCASVVPKKRKRHIEMKHAYGAASSAAASAKAQRKRSGSNVASNQHQENTDDEDGDTIYIDVNPLAGPRSEMSDRQPDRQKNQPAVILQPGNTYSIPSSNSLPYVGITYGNRQMGAAGYGSSGAAQPASSSVSCQTGSNGDGSEEAPSVQEKMPISKRFDAQQTKEDSGEATDGGNSADTGGSSCVRVRRNSTRNPGSSSSRRTQQQQREDLARPYKCDQCGHSFNQRIHLQKHLSKHTGVKPYKCEQCDYATVERSHLKVHIRIHTGEKPFKCAYCEYATAQNSTLKIHLKRHHGGGFMLECSHCGKSFPEKKQFNAHQREHGGEPEDGVKEAVSAAGVAGAADCDAAAAPDVVQLDGDQS